MNLKRLLIASPFIGMLLLLISSIIPAAAQAGHSDQLSPLPLAPSKPLDGIQINNRAELLQQLQHAPNNSTLILAPGEYLGPITIERGITLWGPEDAVIMTNGEGTTVRLHGNNSAALGFTIIGSGTRYDLLDAALELHGDDLRAQGLRIREATFGIIANECKRIVINGNEVIGTGQKAMGLRGDGIRIWETYDSEVSDNRMRAARDMVVWYSSRNKVLRNEVHGCRYGTHFMYCNDNQVVDNIYIGNVVGLFLMYTNNILVQNNLLSDSGGSAGIGLGMKESSDVKIIDNLFFGDERGLYFDNSPFNAGTTIEVIGNEFRFSSIAMAFHDTPKGIIIKGNTFRDNWSLLTIDGGGDALKAEVSGNQFSNYRGYDLDGDGIGDIPFEERSISEKLISGRPSLSFFRGTPAAGMLEAVGRLLPLYKPKPLLRDSQPIM